MKYPQSLKQNSSKFLIKTTMLWQLQEAGKQKKVIRGTLEGSSIEVTGREKWRK